MRKVYLQRIERYGRICYIGKMDPESTFQMGFFLHDRLSLKEHKSIFTKCMMTENGGNYASVFINHPETVCRFL